MSSGTALLSVCLLFYLTAATKAQYPPTKRSFGGEKLAPNFVGHDIKAIFHELASRERKAVKGELETTEEFQARIDREAASPILGKIDKTAVFAFNIESEARYDGQGLMTVTVALPNASKDIYAKTDWLAGKKALTSKTEVRKEQYDGSSAYNFPAKTLVTRHHETYYSIAFSNYNSFNFTRLSPIARRLGKTTDNAILFEMLGDVAASKKLKEHLKVLAIVKLRPPYTYDGKFHKNPMLESPEEYFVEDHFLNTELVELWLYDETTGLIVTRIKAGVN